MPNMRTQEKLTLVRDESGATAVIVAIVITALCGFVGLAVDVGHMVMVKAELQRTADAGALAGAAGLGPFTGNKIEPHWDQGKAKAHTIISNPANLANYQPFTMTDGTVLGGYWCLKPPANYVQNLPTTRPDISYVPEPAVQVTLTKSVNMIIAQIVPGINKVQNVRATSTAILPTISTGIFSIAVESSLVEDAKGAVILTPQDFGWHDQGQWYTEPDLTHQPPDEGNNDVTTVRKNGPIDTGDQVWIAPGAMDTLYHDIIIGQTVILPVVASTEQKQWQEILFFASFQIMEVNPHSVYGEFKQKYASAADLPPSAWGTPRIVSP